MMPDYIHIQDLLLRTIIGVNPEERVNRQDVLISLRLETDLQQAGLSDRMEETLNYRTLCKQVIQLVEGSEFFLVEALAERIAQICLDHERVQSVRVRVEKPGALRFARTVGVEIERCRNDASS